MTQENKFTAGPWLIANNGKKGNQTPTFRIWRTDPGENIDNVGYECISPHVHGKANTHLIAAAPDLYEALKEIKVNLSISPDKITQSRTAYLVDLINEVLSKAEGK